MTNTTIGHMAPAPDKIFRRGHIAFLDGFRALAILSIVAGHSYSFAWGHEHPESNLDFLLPVISGNTALFVFISGFLFHHVFADRFDYGTFMLGKFDKLIKPYAIATAATLAMALAVGGPANSFLFFNGTVSDDPLSIYLVALATGVPYTALWYVPFAILLFALSPAMIAFIRARPAARLLCLLASILLALMVNRAIWNLNLMQNFAYFLPFYLFGIEASLRKQAFGRLSEKLATIVLCSIGVVALAYWQMASAGSPIIAGPPFVWLGFDTMLPQKLLLITAICGVLQRIGKNGKLLGSLASDSFGIFFVHGVVLIWFVEIFGAGGLSGGNKFVDLTLATALVIAVSWMIVRLVKSAAPERSRQIIGA